MNGIPELQAAVYTVLSGYVPLTTLLATYSGSPAIFDGPPQADDAGSDVPFPYLSFGYASTEPDDTDTEVGTRTTVTIHTWARGHALVQVSAIMEQVYNALHREDFAVSGFAFVGCDIVTSETMRDPDGVTVHGVQRFLITYEEE